MPTAHARRWILKAVVVAVLATGAFVIHGRPTGQAAPAGGAGATRVHPASKMSVKAANAVIVDGLSEEPNHLIPAQGPTMTYSGMVMASLFANLYETTPHGTIVPLIANAMPKVSANGLDYTFTLKHTEWKRSRRS